MAITANAGEICAVGHLHFNRSKSRLIDLYACHLFDSAIAAQLSALIVARDLLFKLLEIN